MGFVDFANARGKSFRAGKVDVTATAKLME
jgi:hypothetical protein